MTQASSQKPARNHSLDFAKGIACMLVVCMHCEFPGYLGVFVQCVSRFAVPFFFMVSGYFCFKGEQRVDYVKKVRHILGIIVFATIVYVTSEILQDASLHITRRQLKEWILFNEPAIIAGQLWFLFSLLYDYILFGILDRLGLRQLTKVAIPICLVVYVCMAQGAHLRGIKVENMMYRNFLIEGLPLFSLGYWLHAYEDRIHAPNVVLILGMIVCTALCPVERELVGRDIGINIVTFPQVLCLFILCIKNPGFGRTSWLTFAGQQLSLFVYVLHPFVWDVLKHLYKILKIRKNLTANYLMPPFCIILSLALAFVVAEAAVGWREKKLSRSFAASRKASGSIESGRHLQR